MSQTPTDSLTENELALLDKMESELFKTLPEDTPPPILFHYTNEKAFCGIIDSHAIWATHFRFLNDPGEVIHGEEIVLSAAKALFVSTEEVGVKIFLEMLIDNFDLRASERLGIYVASFSEVGDQLSQWRAYGSGASGYAIGFSDLPRPKAESDRATAGMMLFKCRYNTSLFEDYSRTVIMEMAEGFSAFVRDHANREIVARRFLAQALSICWRRLVVEILRLKHAGFSEESEWRLVVLMRRSDMGLLNFRSTDRGIVPYVQIPLVTGQRISIERVFVGPGDHSELAKLAAELFMEARGYSNRDLVVASKIPYRNAR